MKDLAWLLKYLLFNIPYQICKHAWFKYNNFFALVCVHFDNPSYIGFYLKKKVSYFESQMLLLNEPGKDKVVKAVVHIYEHCKCCFPGRTIYSEFLLLLFRSVNHWHSDLAVIVLNVTIRNKVIWVLNSSFFDLYVV